jgi:hypothetical protein
VDGGYRWQDKLAIGNLVTANGTFDLSQPYHGPSRGLICLWCSYEHRLSRRIDRRIQLNVRNAFARDGLIPISIEPDVHTWAPVRVKPVQEEQLSNTPPF